MQRLCAALALFSMLIHVMLLPASIEVLRLQARAEAKRQIKAGIPSSHRVRFVVDTSRQPVDGTTLTWHHASEFSVNSMMYDVLAERDSADCTILETMADMEEAWVTFGLEGRTHELLGKALSSKHVRRLLQSWIALHSCSPVKSNRFSVAAEKNMDMAVSGKEQLHQQCFKGVEDPPPRVGINHLL